MNTETTDSKELKLVVAEGYRARSDEHPAPTSTAITVTPMDMLKMALSQNADLAKMDKSAVSGRRNTMLKAGILERGLARKCVFSDILCETVKLPGGL